MTVFAILRDAWFFYSRHLGFIARLCLPLLLLEGGARVAVAQWLGDRSMPLQDLFVGLLFYPLYNGALILFLDARSRGLAPRPSELLAHALRLWLPLALVAGISSLLIMLGASLFVLPGLWVMVKVAFAEYLVVLQGRLPLVALRDSFLLTRGHFVPLLGCVLGVIIPLWLLNAWAVSQLPADAGTVPAILLDGGLGLLQLFATVVFFRAFMLALPARA